MIGSMNMSMLFVRKSVSNESMSHDVDLSVNIAFLTVYCVRIAHLLISTNIKLFNAQVNFS